jgi:uncharacterized protein (TIGR02452 family)
VNRTQRSELARQTVEIIERGSYCAPSGRIIDISRDVRRCLETTQYVTPQQLEHAAHDVRRRPVDRTVNLVEVANETTLSGVARLLALRESPVAALNFASARNPGGGFLSGSQAQEESLARSSGLYASLSRAWEFYERHRASPSLLYSDAMILSPNCPVFRDDSGSLLEEPQLVSFITSAAPNAGAVAENQPQDLPRIAEVLRRRSEYVLALAAAHGYKQLVLGAWGCGVFRNDPAMVADAFVALLRGPWRGRFDRVLFSVLDTSASQETFAAFQRAVG